MDSAYLLHTGLCRECGGCDSVCPPGHRTSQSIRFCCGYLHSLVHFIVDSQIDSSSHCHPFEISVTEVDYRDEAEGCGCGCGGYIHAERMRGMWEKTST